MTQVRMVAIAMIAAAMVGLNLESAGGGQAAEGERATNATHRWANDYDCGVAHVTDIDGSGWQSIPMPEGYLRFTVNAATGIISGRSFRTESDEIVRILTPIRNDWGYQVLSETKPPDHVIKYLYIMDYGEGAEFPFRLTNRTMTYFGSCEYAR